MQGFPTATNRDGRIPRQGKYNDAFYAKLDAYLRKDFPDACRWLADEHGKDFANGKLGGCNQQSQGLQPANTTAEDDGGSTDSGSQGGSPNIDDLP